MEQPKHNPLLTAKPEDVALYWYIMGYLEAIIDSMAIDMNVSKKIAGEWLITRLAAYANIKL